MKLKKGFKSLAGFQTRNVPHRAHEHLQRTSLEICDGILIHPLVGWKKSGDFRRNCPKSAFFKRILEYLGGFFKI